MRRVVPRADEAVLLGRECHEDQRPPRLYPGLRERFGHGQHLAHADGIVGRAVVDGLTGHAEAVEMAENTTASAASTDRHPLITPITLGDVPSFLDDLSRMSTLAEGPRRERRAVCLVERLLRRLTGPGQQPLCGRSAEEHQGTPARRGRRRHVDDAARRLVDDERAGQQLAAVREADEATDAAREEASRACSRQPRSRPTSPPSRRRGTFDADGDLAPDRRPSDRRVRTSSTPTRGG